MLTDKEGVVVKKVPRSSAPGEIEGRSLVFNPHPLLTHVIVTQIFECAHFSHADLRSIRQVCKLWYQLSLKLWRDESSVVLGPSTADGQGESWPVDDFCRRFQNTTTDIFKLKETPFKKFTFRKMCLSDTGFLKLPQSNYCSSGNDDDQPNFWNEIGPFVTGIKFRECSFQFAKAETFARVISTSLVNLESLVLCDNSIGTSNVSSHSILEPLNICTNFPNGSLKRIEIQGEAPLRLDSVLSNYPTLEVLKTDRGINLTDFSNECVRTLRLKKIKFCLKHLDVMDHMSLFEHIDDRLTCWQSMRLPLEHLSLTVFSSSQFWFLYNGEDDISDILVPIINHHAASLQVLNILRPPVYLVPGRCPFRKSMNSMRELYLRGNLVRNLDFLVHMPNLQVLYLDFCCYDKVEKMRASIFSQVSSAKFRKEFRPFYGARHSLITKDETMMSLEKMTKLHLNVEVKPSAMRALPAWMPNLKCLKIVAREAGFRMICAWLPNLEELTLLFGSKVTDQDISGLSWGRIERNPNNITAFTKLRRFEVQDLCRGMGSSIIGDGSVNEGFLKMRTLESIKLLNATFNLSAGSEEALRKHVSEVVIIKDGGQHKHHECCAVINAKKICEDFETEDFTDEDES